MSLRVLPLILLLTMAALSQTPLVEPGVSLELAKWRAARYSDVRYKLNLTLEKMSPVLKGTMEIRVKVAEPPASAGGTNANIESTPIILDWRNIRGSENLSAVSKVSINGKVAIFSTVVPSAYAGGSASARTKATGFYFEESNEHLIFRDGVVTGENVIKLDFTSPILTSGSAITRYVDKEDGAEYIYSLFVPSDASTAFPVFDQPDLKAKFDLTLYAPETWQVVSNTAITLELVSAKPYGWETSLCPLSGCPPDYVAPEPPRTYVFHTTKPISTYVFSFTAGPFAEFRERDDNDILNEIINERKGTTKEAGRSRIPVTDNEIRFRNSRIHVRKSQAAKFKPHAAEVFRLNREGIKYLETYFDHKFPFPKYDLVLIPEFPFGGMEHAGATFLREDRVIFPTEPTKNDHITRANLIFHEAAHQWFGDTVTMRWFDDLWLKEGFAEFMAYKTLEKVMPEYNAWKIFYERNKQAAYLTDSTKGTTPIYQEIANLNAAKSAYGNIVYRKAPSFLKQAEFYIGPDKFQTAVRAFLKKHEFNNAEWTDLVKDFETASGKDLRDWAEFWVKRRGLFKVTARGGFVPISSSDTKFLVSTQFKHAFDSSNEGTFQMMTFNTLFEDETGNRQHRTIRLRPFTSKWDSDVPGFDKRQVLIFPNYQDYGYGIFLLDDKSRDYVLKNIHNEKDDFLRTMMWGSLWDSVREAELGPEVYVELVVKNLRVETDESTIQTLLGRVSTAMTYYLSDTQRAALAPKVEAVLIEKMRNAPTLGQRITFYRAFLNIASTENARGILKDLLAGSVPGAIATGFLGSGEKNPVAIAPGSDRRIPLKTKDKFDIVTKLLILGDADAPKLLAELEKTEKSDEAIRYAYAAKAGIASGENKAKFWNDFTASKEISESWIEAAFGPFNSPRHAELTLPFLEKALAELPNLKRSRKIFFVNGWLAAFIGGQRSEQALGIVNKFLADNPNLDKDLRLKILENVDLIERAVKIRGK